MNLRKVRTAKRIGGGESAEGKEFSNPSSVLAEMLAGTAAIPTILACVWSTTTPFLFDTALETVFTVAYYIYSDVEYCSRTQHPSTTRFPSLPRSSSHYSEGPSLSLFLSSWNLMDFTPTHPSSARASQEAQLPIYIFSSIYR